MPNDDVFEVVVNTSQEVDLGNPKVDPVELLQKFRVFLHECGASDDSLLFIWEKAGFIKNLKI